MGYVCSYAPRCTLLTASACAPGTNCYVETAAGEGIAVCLEPSGTAVGELDTCTYINDCETMQDCFQVSSGSSVCLYYCALTGGATSAAPGLGGCPSGETCKNAYGGQAITTGVNNIGLCIPNGGIVPKDGGSTRRSSPAAAARGRPIRVWSAPWRNTDAAGPGRRSRSRPSPGAQRRRQRRSRHRSAPRRRRSCCAPTAR